MIYSLIIILIVIAIISIANIATMHPLISDTRDITALYKKLSQKPAVN